MARGGWTTGNGPPAGSGGQTPSVPLVAWASLKLVRFCVYFTRQQGERVPYGSAPPNAASRWKTVLLLAKSYPT